MAVAFPGRSCSRRTARRPSIPAPSAAAPSRRGGRGPPRGARAVKAWRAQGLVAITLHECRHTFASLMIAAGVNAKALQTFMGHSSITETLDRYGHLMPGSEGAAAGVGGAFLGRARAADVPEDQLVA